MRRWDIIGINMSNAYVRKEIYDIDDVLQYVKPQSGGVLNHPRLFNGVHVKMRSSRYQVFLIKGTDCVCCGAVGAFFALESHKKGARRDNWHFNLYAINKYGHEILMTKDQIIPKSKGGRNHISNLQPMCAKCNHTKDNKVFDQAYVHKERKVQAVQLSLHFNLLTA